MAMNSNKVINVTKEGIGTDCLAILYDTSGFKAPNTQQKDLRGLNIASLGGSNCAFEINGTCYTAPFTPTPLTKDECEELRLKGNIGIKHCRNADNDYWGGAVKTCGGVSKMPNETQLNDIANYVYNTSGISGYKTGLTLDYDKVAELGFTASQGSTFYIWSGEEYTSSYAFYRNFGPTFTNWNDTGTNMYRSNSTLQAVCIGN